MTRALQVSLLFIGLFCSQAGFSLMARVFRDWDLMPDGVFMWSAGFATMLTGAIALLWTVESIER